jgi:molybdopterin-guanine dinucleotide biosynthesis protein A
MATASAAPDRLDDTTGVLIAGGQARRMGGAPKGLLEVGGEPLAARTIRLFRACFAEVLVVANDPAPWEGSGVRVVPDAIPGKGAPGGLHAALLSAGNDWVFAAGCDMPFLSAEGIALLAAWRPGAKAVVPRWHGRLEPLHAFWSVRCLREIEQRLRAGDPSLQQLAEAVGARIVDEAAWREIDPAGRAFENANTPEDAARLGLALPKPRG